MFQKLKELWARLTAPYDEELEEAKAVVCDACHCGSGFCYICPVMFANCQENTESLGGKENQNMDFNVKIIPTENNRTYAELPDGLRLIFEANGQYVGHYNPDLSEAI